MESNHIEYYRSCAVVIEKASFLRGKNVGMPRGRRGLSYMLHRWGPWGPITSATSSLAILPQIATLKRGTAPAVAGATESADCSVHRLRLATSVLQLEPPHAPFAQPPRKEPRVFSPPASSTPTIRLSAACNTVIGQFRGFSSE